MNYTTEFDDRKGVCMVFVTGTHKRPGDSLILQQFARDFGRERNCQRFLFDMTKAEITGGMLGMYETGNVPVDSDNKQTHQRIALLYSHNLNEHKFLETVALNRGYQVHVFDEIDKALKWLV